jgi:hypothetical protein
MARVPLPTGMAAEALDLPAIFANHVQIFRLGTNLVRISFAETPVPDAPFYRSAILMAVEDAQNLAAALVQALNTPVSQQLSPGSRPN